jgi:hypothetical protein
MFLVLRAGMHAEVEAAVAADTPVGGEVEGAIDVAFDDAAGALAIDFVATAVGTRVRFPFWRCKPA